MIVWISLGFWLLVFVVWKRRTRRPVPRVVIDGEGVERSLGSGRVERIRWEDLVAVDVITTSDGPFADDIYWCLIGADGSGCAVPGTSAEGLLERLGRLPRIDNLAIVRACGSFSDARFEIWRGTAGEGAICT